MPSQRALQGTIRSFDITITFVNSIGLEEGYAIEITFEGTSGLVLTTYTVYAPAPGETAFYYYCLDVVGETDISTGSDMDDTVLIVVSNGFLTVLLSFSKRD